jgi:hypothetical protein
MFKFLTGSIVALLLVASMADAAPRRRGFGFFGGLFGVAPAVVVAQPQVVVAQPQVIVAQPRAVLVNQNAVLVNQNGFIFRVRR